MADGTETCPDCGVTLPRHPGPAHPYFGASPSCWALYGTVLAREYQDPALMRVHRLTVDAYAAQHPGTPERRASQSAWVHLAGLYLTLDRGLSPGFVRRVMAELTKNADRLPWLEPPSTRDWITVAEVAAADTSAHVELVQRWAGEVWGAWRAHLAAVAEATDRIAARL